MNLEDWDIVERILNCNDSEWDEFNWREEEWTREEVARLLKQAKFKPKKKSAKEWALLKRINKQNKKMHSFYIRLPYPMHYDFIEEEE